MNALRANPVAGAAILIAVIGAATLSGAWFFQFVLGYPPCPLCLDERMPYYFGIPLAVLVALGANFGAARKVLIGALVVIALGMLWNAGLSAYHSGVEWKWWPGPTDCSGPISDFGSAGNLLQKMQTTRVVRCDEAAWRLFGISLAGYNALISLALAAIAAWGAAMARYMPERE